MRDVRDAAPFAPLSGRELASVLDATDLGVCCVDRDGRCTYLNRAAAVVLGYEADALLGRSLHDAVHARLADGTPHPESECAVLRSFRRGEPTHLSAETFWRGGVQPFLGELTCHPIVEDGVVAGGVVTLRDVSRQLELEREHAATLAHDTESRRAAAGAEALYRGLFEGAADAILVADERGRYLDANPAATALLGYARDELLRLAVPDIVSDAAWGAAEYARFVEVGTWRGELEVRRKDGVLVPVEASAKAVPSPAGTVYISTLRDISSRRQFEEQRAFERERLRQIIDELPAGVALYEPGGRISVRSRAYEEILGPATPDIGGVVASYRPRHPDGTAVAEADMPGMRALRGEAVVAEQYLAWNGRLGHDVTILVNAAPLRRGDEIQGAVVAFEDITPLKDLERERIEFFEMASHEIRTPVTTIWGQVQLARRLLERGAERQRIAMALAMADRQIARMVSLVQELLDLSRIQAARLEIVAEPLDLVAAAREAVARVAASTERHTIALDAPDQLEVRADPRRIDQVFDNLLENAVKYSPHGGTIRISIERADREGAPRAVVRVADEGLGVPPGEREHLFEPFFRTSTSAPYAGAGLGLYISRDFVRRHGGDLALERSAPGEGSAFAFWLPV